MHTISLTFPDQTYTSSNKPTTTAVKSDFSTIETGHNNLDAVVATEHNTDGTHTSATGITGEVRMWTTATAPSSWLLCNGSAVNRTTYASLYAVIGTTYGAGDGSTTFNVPNMQGKIAVGVSATDGDYDLADTGGAKTYDVSHTHTGPSHTHTGPSHTHSGPNHRHSYSGTSSNNSASGTMAGGPEGVALHPHTHTYSGNTGYSGTGNTGAGGTGNTGSSGTGNTGSGGSSTQNVINPYMALNYIIKI